MNKNWDLIRIFESVNKTTIPKNSSLIENIQLADKLYFKTGKLDQSHRDILMSITNGDNYSKFIADALYYAIDNNVYANPTKEIRRIYDSIKNYNKNVFPIKGFTDINNINHIGNFLYALEKRDSVIDLFKKLPSIASRNLKNDIRTERDGSELERYRNLTEYLISHLSYISNRDEKIQSKIIQKMFKNGTTMSQLTDFVEDKENLLGGVKVSKDQIIQVVKENSNDMDVVYQNGNIMVVRVESPQAIKNIGCTSLWCFTYGTGFDNAYRQWNNYSTNDIVYVIIDFNEQSDSSDFMHVVIKPIEWDEQVDPNDMDDEGVNSNKVFDMGNDQLDYPLNYLIDVFGNVENASKVITFEY